MITGEGRKGSLAHEEALGLLDAWREGELSEEEDAAVAAHVAGCDRCRAVEAALGGGLKSALTARLPRHAGAATSLLPGVQRRIRLRSRGRFYPDARDARRGPSPWPILIGSVAVLVALIVSYILVGQVGWAPVPSGATTGSGMSSSASGAK